MTVGRTPHGIFSHLRIGSRLQIRPNKGFNVKQMNSFGEAVELARKFKGYSRAQLSTFMLRNQYVLDKPGLYVSLLEQNKVTPTKLDLERLQIYLGVDFRKNPKDHSTARKI